MAARTGHGNTPGHLIRIPKDLWEQARTKAQQQGTTVSAIVREALRDYIAR